jgi:hypothetical protein
LTTIIGIATGCDEHSAADSGCDQQDRTGDYENELYFGPCRLLTGRLISFHPACPSVTTDSSGRSTSYATGFFDKKVFYYRDL